MDQAAIEPGIRAKAKEWIDEYGADFLVELIGDYLEDASVRLARLIRAAAADAGTLMLEAHTLKSSSASLGAQGLSTLAKRLEDIGRDGDLSVLADNVEQFARQFAAVKASLEKLRDAPNEFITQER
jgi:HPt (histidine-containing phosphotransfer) domain-containing protein